MSKQEAAKREKAIRREVYPVGHPFNPRVVCVPAGKYQAPIRIDQPHPLFLRKAVSQ